jgi:hypothetical protein
MMEKLKLIFGRVNAAISLLIRIFDNCPFGHVAIVIGEWVYEALGSRYKGRVGRRKGVVKTHISAFKKRYSAWREGFIYLPPGKTAEQVQAGAEEMVAKKLDYDFAETVTSLWLLQIFKIRIDCKHAVNCASMINVLTGVFTAGVVTVASWFNILRPMQELDQCQEVS